jgi:hypothetical protein
MERVKLRGSFKPSPTLKLNPAALFNLKPVTGFLSLTIKLDSAASFTLNPAETLQPRPKLIKMKRPNQVNSLDFNSPAMASHRARQQRLI